MIHCLDQWPISVTTGPISKKSKIYDILSKISIWTYRQADVITISSKSFQKYFENELRISSEEKGLIYYPSYAENTYQNMKFVDNKMFDIVFAGNVGPAQSCETIVECAELLKEKQDIHFHIVGDGLSREACEKSANEKGLKNITFHGMHKLEEMPKYYSLADAFIITMVDNEVVNSTLPAKIQSYMLAGKPIFGAISGEVKEVVEEAECGKCTISGNAEELAHLIEHYYQNADLLKQWGENGLKYYQKHFEKEKCISDLEKIFGDIIGKKKESYAKTR